MALKRTTNRLPHVSYGEDSRVEFDQGVRTTDEYDGETEQWAATTFEDIVRIEGENDSGLAEDDDRVAEREAADLVTEQDHPR